MINQINAGDYLRVTIRGAIADVLVVKLNGTYNKEIEDIAPIDILVELKNEERLWIKSYAAFRNLTEEQTIAP